MSWGMVGLIVFLVVGVAAWIVWVAYSIATGWDGTDYGDGYQWPDIGDDLGRVQPWEEVKNVPSSAVNSEKYFLADGSTWGQYPVGTIEKIHGSNGDGTQTATVRLDPDFMDRIIKPAGKTV